MIEAELNKRHKEGNYLVYHHESVASFKNHEEYGYHYLLPG
jgi:hypothetical protein